jgi:hypothetical protein
MGYVWVTLASPIPMFKRRKTDAAMWINPRSNLNGGGHIAWDRRKTDAGNARYLELADVALNPKTADPGEAKPSVAANDGEAESSD